MGISIKDVNSNTVNALVSPNQRINIDEPRYDQSTYIGRAKHFFITTNPLNLLCTSEDLDKAKDVVTRYKNGENLSITEDELWRAKSIYDSAFHPDTGEKLVLVGRMSAQVPMNMFITGAMLTFYKSSKQVIFWQWFNQSFNAIVNYSNRSGDSPISVPQLAGSYVAATSGALITALGLNSLVKRAPSLIGRFVPFTAVAAANCVNIPFMRSNEIKSGAQVYHEDGTFVGNSPVAAKEGVVKVVISRICMAVPSMVIPPIIMDRLEKRGFLKRFPWASAPMQILMCGFCLTFATPFGCALFPQKASIEVSKLEPELQERIRAMPSPPTVVYYNKGL